MAKHGVNNFLQRDQMANLVRSAAGLSVLVDMERGEIIAASATSRAATLGRDDHNALLSADDADETELLLGGAQPRTYAVAFLDLDGLPHVFAQATEDWDTPPSQVSDAESRFRALSDSVPVGIFLCNTDGRVMYVNERWTEISGRSPNDAAARGWLDGIHPDDEHRVRTAWQTYLTEPGPFQEEFRYRRDEADVWVTARIVTFTDATGDRLGYLGSIADISDLKRAEAELKASETRYRTIFDNILDVYYETSLTGEILEVSPSIELMTDYSRSELLGQSMLAFYKKGEDRDAFLNTLLDGGGTLHDYEIDLRDRHGQQLSCAITCRLHRDQDGNPEKIIGSMRDITRRKAAEEMLQVERANLELIARDLPLHQILENLVRSIEAQAPGMLCSVLLVDPDGKRLRTGAAPSLPRAYNAAIDGIEIGPTVGCCGRAASTKSCVFADDIAESPHWKEFAPLAIEHGLRSCWSHPILDSRGDVLGTFAMYYREAGSPDTHHKHLIQTATHLAAIAIERRRIDEERENLESQVRQAQKLESLGILAGGIAHDFNNLLTGIMGYASLAEHTLAGENSDALHHVERISSVARQAANLTKQMLAYSGKGKFVVVPLDLSEAVADMRHLLDISVSKKARLRYAMAENLPQTNADPAQIQQVVMNLVTNASEALGDQSGDITIATGLVEAEMAYLNHALGTPNLDPGTYVYIEVRDDGCGMDDDTRARIFDPFFTTKFTGRGLGMSAVLGIMRGHAGGVLIDSERDQGTTIRLLFPSLGDEPNVVSDWQGIVADKSDWNGDGTVLVVDDEETVRNLAAKMFAAQGFRVLTACDGEQALTVFAQNPDGIDLVLLDITMPNKDGFETLRALRERGSKVRVLLSSGYNHQEMAERSVEHGADGFLQKPYTRDMLLDAVRDVLSRVAT